MSLDVFNPLAADQNVVQNAARDLPADFSEAFDVSTRAMTEWNSSLNFENARDRSLASFYDGVKAMTGVQLPLYGMGGNVSLDDLNEAIAKLPQQPGDVEPSFAPLSEGSIRGMALERMRKAHGDAEAFAHRETSWSGTAGTVLGTLAGGVSDPVTLATLPLGGAGQLGIAGRALEFAAIAGGTEAAIAAAGGSSREAASPGSLKEIPGEIASATLFGGVLGAGLGGLSKLLGHGAKPLPTTVRDEVNAAASEAQFNVTNPFPTAASDAAHRDGVISAVQSAIKGEPVKAGDQFFEAYHGSPYEFDRFDVSKIDTGEGMQSYGHGLYFAENPATAKDYATALGAKRGVYDMDQNSPTLGEFQHVSEGHVYSVRIAADQQRMLDWDKPLSEQPAIAEAFGKVTPKPGWLARQIEGLQVIRHDMATDPNSTGARAYSALSRLLGGDKAASEALREAGIHGIKYLDAGSRDAGAGTRNFVVFDDKHVQIVGRDGKPVSADYALAAKSHTPEELAIAGEKHLRPETYGLAPDVERFDRMPGEADDVASYWDRRLEAATPEDRAALGATDGQEVDWASRLDLQAKTDQQLEDFITATKQHVSNFELTINDPLELKRQPKETLEHYASQARIGHEGIAAAEAELQSRRVSAPDITPEQLTRLAAEPATESASLHNLEHIIAEKPDLEFSTQIRQPDGSYQLATRKLSDVLGEIDGLEAAGKELEACAAGLAQAAE